MGVKGLWRLLLPIGRRISIETLEGKILAIDASIWLTQFLTVAARQREQELLGDGSAYGTGNRSGKAYSYDYLVGFLRRLCKLRYQGVRPVLVFDGETPEIKRREIRERNKRRKRKLGETFYLGDSTNNGDVPTQEEEEVLEATRRMAKRILAKQLKSGKLITTKNKQANKKLKTINDKATNAKSKEAAISSASYAPGFYDPGAPRAIKSTKPHEPSTDKSVSKEIDDDHLLRDDYNTNPLKEEVNDWDRPIVLDSDDDSQTNNNIKKSGKPTTQPKKSASIFFGSASRFHAGDGTKFKVDSVADLNESARKDVIEDALKQRRLASRREFMGVASNPDGLSSCQLRNFLKSTKLNRDIAAMAQQAKRKAEEEAKMTLGNGILFEKDNENDRGLQRSGGSNNSRSNTGFAASRRPHYRSGAYNIGQKSRKAANPGMMRMFHHKDQLRRNNSIVHKNTYDDDSDDDEHDFRKARNNHYLSGGIRFVNSDEEKDKIDYMDDNLDEEKDTGRPHYLSKVNEDDGGFAIAIMDGSDKPKTKISVNDAISNGGDDIIEIDSSSESDGDHSEDDRKPAAANQNGSSSKASQELQDEALARALQDIEDEEMVDEKNPGECIEIDDSGDGSSEDGGGFFRNALPSPSRENIDTKSQQERDDECLARALQETEYGEEEDSDGGGGFLIGAKEDKINKEENMTLVPTREIENVNDDSTRNKKDFLVPSTNGAIGTINSQLLNFPSHAHEKTACSTVIANKEVSLPREGWNPFESNGFKGKMSKGIFATNMSKQENVQDLKNDLLVCPESSDEEQEDDINWEEGNVQQEETSNIEKHDTYSQRIKETPVIDRKDTEENGSDEEVDWEEGTKEKSEKKATVIDVSVVKNGMKPNDINKTRGIKETVENSENGIDWKEDDNENELGTKIVTDICLEKKSTEKLIETKFNSTDKDEFENDNDEEDEDEVDWEEGDNEHEFGTTTITDKCSENKSTEKLIGTKFNSTHEDKSENDNDEEDDNEVDWEDGDGEINQNKPEYMDSCEERKSAYSFQKPSPQKPDDGEDNVDWVDGAEKVDRRQVGTIDLCGERDTTKSLEKSTFNSVKGNLKKDSKPMIPAQTQNEKLSDEKLSEVQHDSSIQEVEDANGRNMNNEESSKYFDVPSKSLSKAIKIVQEDDSDDETDAEWESGEKRTMVELDDWGVTKTHRSDEVAAALEHAQGTAANLTNWAGRAFRRAIAQHAIENGMEVPESARPTVLKNTRGETNADEQVSNDAKTAVRSPQRISQGSMKSRNQERRIEGEKIDNSGWLETVDTENTYTEDYTVPPQEANSSDRLLDATAGGVTEEMRTEVMQLLRLFGIPYVVAPAEAEAQCVELERLGLVDGIVTEDSDTFVFGGQVVYKNIFDDKKYVEVYHAKDASEEMNLTQDSLVALAMLLGGDYTEGVKGVGIVNGMEVLQAFDVAQDCESGLKRFRKWLDGFDPNDLTQKSKPEDAVEVRSEKEQIFHRKHHTARTRWIAPKHFPDAKVLNAYLNPVVDTSTERFSWGVPDLDGLIAFCHGHMGWVAEETEKLIVPIIQQMEGGSMRQTRIDSFMRYEDGIKFAKIQSKRLRQVLGLSSTDKEQPRRKRVHSKVPPTSQNEAEGNENEGFSDGEDSFGEPDEEIFAALDTSSMAMQNKPHEKSLKKKYNGKKTRSLAALSSASASTIAIASSSKNDSIGQTSTKGASVSAPRRSINLPKKAPPSYQKQSSTILEEEEESSAQPLGGSKSKSATYEVINPSMI